MLQLSVILLCKYKYHTNSKQARKSHLGNKLESYDMKTGVRLTEMWGYVTFFLSKPFYGNAIQFVCSCIFLVYYGLDYPIHCL